MGFCVFDDDTVCKNKNFENNYGHRCIEMHSLYERWRKKIKRKEEEARSKKLMNQMEELWAEDARKSQNQNTH